MFDQAEIIFTPKSKKELWKRSEAAQKAGDLGMVKRTQALLALAAKAPPPQIAAVLQCSVQAVYLWSKDFILTGLDSLRRNWSGGRPAKLTGKQKQPLAAMIDAGPGTGGYAGEAWRSPLIQDLIFRQFGKFYSVKYIAELLKNLGFSYQKARFVADHPDEKKRAEWLANTWPEILALSRKKKALIVFGDEVSFPMWGSLSYTWRRRGRQHTVKTTGKRKGYKVFGLISYTDGKFFSAGTEERFNSNSYLEFIQGVLAKTKRHIILIQDGAKYHVSKQTRDFFQARKERLTVCQLPSYSPDYNPIERLWKKIKPSHLHRHYFPTFSDLKDKVQEAMLKYQDLQDEILKRFGFYRKFKTATN